MWDQRGEETGGECGAHLPLLARCCQTVCRKWSSPPAGCSCSCPLPWRCLASGNKYKNGRNALLSKHREEPAAISRKWTPQVRWSSARTMKGRNRFSSGVQKQLHSIVDDHDKRKQISPGGQPASHGREVCRADRTRCILVCTRRLARRWTSRSRPDRSATCAALPWHRSCSRKPRKQSGWAATTWSTCCKDQLTCEFAPLYWSVYGTLLRYSWLVCTRQHGCSYQALIFLPLQETVSCTCSCSIHKRPRRPCALIRFCSCMFMFFMGYSQWVNAAIAFTASITNI